MVPEFVDSTAREARDFYYSKIDDRGQSAVLLANPVWAGRRRCLQAMLKAPARA